MSKVNPKELRNWMYGTHVSTIDAVLEYLGDQGLLNKKGKELAHMFWEKYIHNKDENV